PLERQVDTLGRRVLGLALGICAVVGVVGVLHGQSIGSMIETAISLADQGRDVTLVREEDNISVWELGLIKAMPILTGMLQEKNIKPLFLTKVRNIEKNGVTVVDAAGKSTFVEADTVVLSRGRSSNRKLAAELQERFDEVHEIGDCVTPHGVADAVYGGRVIGASI
ncbi:MAG: FAD-dependent oxidoreductase, partial [Deltaproteobacteria bacterium]|nr:FAD-dependent oxidoreductase [Deltaproteobacteria bacterium]